MEIVSIPSPFTFNWTVPNVDKIFTKVSSPTFVVEGTPWRVDVSVETKSENYLSVYLHCAKTDKQLHWSHAASASFKLLTFGNAVDAIEKTFEPYAFTSDDNGYGFSHFLALDDLFDVRKNYVKDNTVKFQVKIVADSNGIDKPSVKTEQIGQFCECKGLTIFRVTVNNIENLMAVRTNFELRNLKWILTIAKESSSHLYIQLQSKNKGENGASCEVDMTVKLNSSKDDVKPIEKSQKRFIRTSRGESLNIKKFIPWTELLKARNGFVQNGAVTLEVKVQMGRPEDAQKRSITTPSPAAKVPKMECVICKKSMFDQDISSISCGHLFCTPCIREAIQKRKICPNVSCKAKVAWNSLRRIHLPSSEDSS